jgi:SAM-dependent methyltransferase
VKSNRSISVGHQEDRGRLVVRFIEEAIHPLGTLDVLDLGCGQGEISAALSSCGARLTSTDISVNNIKRTREKLEATPHPILTCASSALALPFAASRFDLVVLNGVLEWVGKGDIKRDPEACQIQALTEVHRILRRGGWLYVAIENRSYPRWIFHDPHVGTPLVAVLPRWAAKFVYRLLKGRSYVTYIHSYWKLRSLLGKAGFREMEVYIPLFHYRWPFRVVPVGESRRMASEVVALKEQFRKTNSPFSLSLQLKFALYQYTALLGLSRLFFPSFVVLARRQ